MCCECARIYFEKGGEKVKRHENEMDIIYKRYSKDVLRFAFSLSGNWDVAEEITQNTFYKAVQSVNKFRGDCDIRVWLFQIAKNDYLNDQRKRKRISSEVNVEELLANIPSCEEPILTKIEDAESAWEIRKVLEKMEEPYREVFTLRVIHKMSYEKIADLYGKSESWARVTFYRAKMKIIDEVT